MCNSFSAIAMIAERRIKEAVEKGDLDDLPGAGKPLKIEDLSNIPEELRMAYKILKNSGCLPPELERRKEAASLANMLDSCPSEREKIKIMKKLRFLLQKASLEKSGFNPAWDDEYYAKILARLEKHERPKKPVSLTRLKNES